MNKFIAGFISGAIAGGVATYFYCTKIIKKKIQEQANRDVAEVKEMLKQRYENAAPATEEKEEVVEEKVVSVVTEEVTYEPAIEEEEPQPEEDEDEDISEYSFESQQLYNKLVSIGTPKGIAMDIVSAQSRWAKENPDPEEGEEPDWEMLAKEEEEDEEELAKSESYEPWDTQPAEGEDEYGDHLVILEDSGYEFDDSFDQVEWHVFPNSEDESAFIVTNENYEPVDIYGEQIGYYWIADILHPDKNYPFDHVFVRNRKLRMYFMITNEGEGFGDWLEKHVATARYLMELGYKI